MHALKKVIFCFILISLFTSIVSASTDIEYNTINATDSTTKTSWIKKVENWYEKNMNYGSITALMVVESSFIPFPSEVVIPPAAYIASKPESKLNIILVVLFGTIGALIGAYVNYFLALFLGRPVIYKLVDSKFGKLLLLNSEKVRKAETYFNDHGKVSTFVGRLIPVIRQLISLPAGFSKMHFGIFTFYTFLGAGLWNVILALVGYLAHGQSDLIEKYSQEFGNIFLIVIGAVILYFVVKYIISNKKTNRRTTNK